jgi:hypothetical protein
MGWQADWHSTFLSHVVWVKFCIEKYNLNACNFDTAMKLNISSKIQQGI